MIELNTGRKDRHRYTSRFPPSGFGTQPEPIRSAAVRISRQCLGSADPLPGGRMLEIGPCHGPRAGLPCAAYRSWCKARRSLRGTDPGCSALPARGAVPVLASLSQARTWFRSLVASPARRWMTRPVVHRLPFARYALPVRAALGMKSRASTSTRVSVGKIREANSAIPERGR